MTIPDLGHSVRHGRFTTNYLEAGTGEDVVLLIHGSGPGVTAYANWRLVMPQLAERYRVIAPDVAGFGYTQVEGGVVPGQKMWVEHIVTFLEALEIERASVVGNSFGGALTLWLALEHPELVDRIVLMGSVGVPFELTPGLDAVWGYEPSVEEMERLLRYFVWDRALLPENLGQLRYEASIAPGAQERWASLFPAPRQRWIDEFALTDAELASLMNKTLVVHGRDDQVIPLETSLRLLTHIDDATLHVFPHTGHWVQIERANEFSELVKSFLAS